MTAGPSPYDLVPYPGVSIPPTRPDRIALASWREGGPVPRLDAPNVLEVGCGDGANVLGLAFYRRSSSWLGVDASRRHIETAQAGVAALDLDPARVRFLHADVGESGWEPAQPLDLIIAHGFFSWVNDATADRFLTLCRERLAPGGLAYISYNVLPGWSVRGIVRDALMAATRNESRHEARGHLAVEVARRLREFLEDEEHPYHRLLAHELELAVGYGAQYLLYDHLNPDNRAFYFDDFRRRVEERGLRYVADAAFNRSEGVLPERVAAIAEAGLPLDPERIVDVLGMRQFRTSVVCRADAPGGRPLATTDLASMTLATDLFPCQGADEEHLHDEDPAQAHFVTPAGERVQPGGVFSAAAMTTLSRAGMPGATLADLERAGDAACRERGVEPGEVDREAFREGLLSLWSRDLVDLRAGDGYVPDASTGRPHLLARWEASRSEFRTTPDHELIRVEPSEAEAWLAWANGGEPPDPGATRRYARLGILG